MNTDEIVKCISNALNGVEITENTTSDDVVEWDSVGHLMIMNAIESQFGVSFPFDQLAEFNSVKKIADFVAENKK